MLLALAFAASLFSDFDFYGFGPYDEKVPRPEQILGYSPGERHTTLMEQEVVLRAIQTSANERVQITYYGKSTEGRPLRILTFSDPENMNNLDEIKAYNQKIADGEINPEDVDPNAPVIVWINECIHGNETASFESAMWLCYTLAASQNPKITDALKKSVVIVNPCYNPDGHERYVVWYNSIARGDKSEEAVEHQEPWMQSGRGNHYRFDLNRDRVAMSQVETQQEVAEFRKWNPHVYVDQHGQVGTYFFPPVAQSIHKEVGRERYIELSTLLGKATAKAFDEQGWRYYTRETFDLYYPGYLDSWTSLNGAIGMTHETDGGHAVQQEREDGSVVTLRDGMEKHFVSALAVVTESVEERTKFVKSFALSRATSAEVKPKSSARYALITGDWQALRRFENVLFDHGIETKSWHYRESARVLEAMAGKEGSVKFDGNLVQVDLQQRNGSLARSLLIPTQDFEHDFSARQMAIQRARADKEKYPNADWPEFYDVTGWCLPIASGLDLFFSDSPLLVDSPGDIQPIPYDPTDNLRNEEWLGKAGAYLYGSPLETRLMACDLLNKGARLHVSTKPMTANGNTLAAGTIFFFRDRNEQDIGFNIWDFVNKRGTFAIPLETSFSEEGVVGPGSDSVVPLTKPEIAIVFGDQPNGTQFGSAWFAFEKTFNLPFTAISQRTLNGDLDKYTCIILPRGGRPTDDLKKWVEGGGVLIALGNDSVIGKDNYIDLEKTKLKDGKEPTEIPGALFKAFLNPRSLLAYGYDLSKPIAVPVSGNTFYKKKEAGGGVVMLGDEPQVLSGWTWPDESEALKDTVWMHDQPMGRGHVVWFAEDPTDRAMWQGTYKLVLNAVLMGKKQ